MGTDADRLGEEEIARLLAACARRDRDAFRHLYERTAPQLMGCLVGILRQRAVAEEALQDVFVQVWNRAGQYDAGRGSAWGWLVAIARYRAIDLRRREGRFVVDAEARLESLPADTESTDPAPTGLGTLAGRKLGQCLAALQPRQRECIVLAFQGGLSHAEVALQVAEPLGSVKSWIRRGLTALKRCLES